MSSIRIPQQADIETQNAFRDVERWLRELDAAAKAPPQTETVVEPAATPSLTPLGDTSIVGDLRVDGSLNVRGNVSAPQILDGLVVATPVGTGDLSSAQRVVEVHGSLAVLNALSAETVRSRNLQTYNLISAPYGLVYRLHTDAVDVGNVGVGEDDLMTYIVPAGLLAADNQVIRVTAWGTYATNANTKLIRAYFGATGILLAVAGFQPSDAGWRAQFHVVRTGAASQILEGLNIVRDAAGSSFVFTPAEATPAETLANSITLKMTGEASSNNDIVQKGMIVELLT